MRLAPISRADGAWAGVTGNSRSRRATIRDMHGGCSQTVCSCGSANCARFSPRATSTMGPGGTTSSTAPVPWSGSRAGIEGAHRQGAYCMPAPQPRAAAKTLRRRVAAFVAARAPGLAWARWRVEASSVLCSAAGCAASSLGGRRVRLPVCGPSAGGASSHGLTPIPVVRLYGSSGRVWCQPLCKRGVNSRMRALHGYM